MLRMRLRVLTREVTVEFISQENFNLTQQHRCSLFSYVSVLNMQGAWGFNGAAYVSKVAQGTL